MATLPSLLSGIDDLIAVDKHITKEIESLGAESELEQKKALQSRLFFTPQGMLNTDNELVRVANRFQQEYNRIFAGIKSGNLRAHEVSETAERLEKQQQDFVKLYRDYLETLPEKIRAELEVTHKKSLAELKDNAATKIDTEAKKRLGVEELKIEDQMDEELKKGIKKAKQDKEESDKKFDTQIASVNDQTVIDDRANKLKESLKKQTQDLQTIANSQAHISFAAHYVDKHVKTKLDREAFTKHSDAEFLAEAAKRTENNSRITVIKFIDSDAKKYSFTSHLSKEAQLVISVKEQGNGQIIISCNLQDSNGMQRYFYSDENFRHGLRAAVRKLATYPNIAVDLATTSSKHHNMVVEEWIKAGRTLDHVEYPGVPGDIPYIIVKLTEQNASLSHKDLKAYLALSEEDKSKLVNKAGNDPNIKKLYDIHVVLEAQYNKDLHAALNSLSQANFNKIQGHAKYYFAHLGRLERSGSSPKTVEVAERKPVKLVTINHDAFKQHVYSIEKLRKQAPSSDHSRFIDDKYSLETKIDIFSKSNLHIWKQREIIEAIDLGSQGQNGRLLKKLIEKIPDEVEQKRLCKQKFGKDSITDQEFDASSEKILPEGNSATVNIEGHPQEIIDKDKLTSSDKGRMLDRLLDAGNKDVKKHIAKCLFGGATDMEKTAQIFINISEENRAQLLKELQEDPNLLANINENAIPNQAAGQNKNSPQSKQNINPVNALANMIENTNDPLVLQHIGKSLEKEKLIEIGKKLLLENTAINNVNAIDKANINRLREILKGIITYQQNDKKPTSNSEQTQLEVYLQTTAPLAPAAIAKLYRALTPTNKKKYISESLVPNIGGNNNFQNLLACAQKMHIADARDLLETLGNKGLVDQQKQIFDKLKPEMQVEVFSALTPDNQKAVIKSAEAKSAVAYLNTLPSAREVQKAHLAQIFNAIDAQDDKTKQVNKAYILAHLSNEAATAVLTAKGSDGKTMIIDQAQYDELGKIFVKQETSMAMLKKFHEIRKFENKEILAKLFPKDKKKEVENTGANIGLGGQ